MTTNNYEAMEAADLYAHAVGFDSDRMEAEEVIRRAAQSFEDALLRNDFADAAKFDARIARAQRRLDSLRTNLLMVANEVEAR